MNKNSLTEYMRYLVEEKKISCCAIEVFEKNRKIYGCFAGWVDPERRYRLDGSHLFYGYSVTKVFMTVVMMQLIGEGKVSVSDPVFGYIPRFAGVKVKDKGICREPAEELTVGHLLTMTGGIAYNWNSPALKDLWREDPGADTERIVCAIAGDFLRFDPGSDFLYGFSMDVLGRIAEIAEKKKLSKIMEERIFSPLGMKDSYLGNPRKKRERIVPQYQYGSLTKSIRLCHERKQSFFYPWENLESGGGGIISSAPEMILFADALACGGRGANGYQLLPEADIWDMSENKLAGQSLKTFQAWQGEDFGYGYGVRTRIKSRDHVPVGEFGWSGAGGCHLSVNGADGLSFVYTQQILDHEEVMTQIHPQLYKIIYE